MLDVEDLKCTSKHAFDMANYSCKNMWKGPDLMIQPAETSYRDPHRWMVFSVICLIYFFVYFHRVSTSVIVSDLPSGIQHHSHSSGVHVVHVFLHIRFQSAHRGISGGPHRSTASDCLLVYHSRCWMFHLWPGTVCRVGFCGSGPDRLRCKRSLRSDSQGIVPVVQQESIYHNGWTAYVRGQFRCSSRHDTPGLGSRYMGVASNLFSHRHSYFRNGHPDADHHTRSSSIDESGSSTPRFIRNLIIKLD